MQSLKSLGYVEIGMILIDLNGNELTVTNIIEPNGKEMVIELDGGVYLYTTIGWEHLNERIMVKNPRPRFGN